MESIQVDVIFSSLKELQEGGQVDRPTSEDFIFDHVFPPEKLRNEKVLAEEYSKRKQLEAKVATGIKILS